MKEKPFSILSDPSNGCELRKSFGESSKDFGAIFIITRNNPCLRCAWGQGCKLRIKLEATPAVNAITSYETNSKIAERLGVSKRQVAKMRKRGEI